MKVLVKFEKEDFVEANNFEQAKVKIIEKYGVGVNLISVEVISN